MIRLLRALLITLALAAGAGAGCGDDQPEPVHEDAGGAGTGITVTRLFPSESAEGPEWADCAYASPLTIESDSGERVLVAAGDRVTAVEPDTGEEVWDVRIASPEGRVAWIVATPVVVEDTLIVAFARTELGSRDRLSQHLLAIDLAAGAIDERFAEVELRARKPSFDGTAEIEFLASNAVARSTLVHAEIEPGEPGLVYVSFGNIRDVQPWHGWVFEIDLGAWRDRGAASAVSAVLLTTPEQECGEAGESGSRDMRCGAGVWAPSGPKVYSTDDGFELLVPTGNGALDLARRDYAHTLLRTTRGLEFDPHCDPELCAEFDPRAPADACVASCRDLFVPRLLPDDPPLRPASGVCDELTFFECYARLDWDLGANSPARVALGGDRAGFVLPAKDGAVYLIDAEHLGTLHDREQIADICGTADDPCTENWAGMMVTEPVVTEVDGAQVALVSTFVFDQTHPAGLVALRVDDEPQGPRLTPLWQAPDFADEEARQLFRRHPTRVALQSVNGRTYAWLANVVARGTGTLLGIDVRDGAIAARVPLHGRGQRFVEPLVLGERVFLTSCASDSGPSRLEGYAVAATAHHSSNAASPRNTR